MVVKVAAATKPEGEELCMDLTFEPCRLGEARDVLEVTSPVGGTFEVPLVGTCTLPQRQGPFECKAGQGKALPFRNVFNDALTYSFTVDSPSFTLNKPSEAIPPKKDTTLAVTFKALPEDPPNPKAKVWNPFFYCTPCLRTHTHTHTHTRSPSRVCWKDRPPLSSGCTTSVGQTENGTQLHSICPFSPRISPPPFLVVEVIRTLRPSFPHWPTECFHLCQPVCIALCATVPVTPSVLPINSKQLRLRFSPPPPSNLKGER